MWFGLVPWLWLWLWCTPVGAREGEVNAVPEGAAKERDGKAVGGEEEMIVVEGAACRGRIAALLT